MARYITIKQYVDVETGELITEFRFKREEWEIIQKSKKYTHYEKNNQHYTEILWTYEIRESKQLSLWG